MRDRVGFQPERLYGGISQTGLWEGRSASVVPRILLGRRAFARASHPAGKGVFRLEHRATDELHRRNPIRDHSSSDQSQQVHL